MREINVSDISRTVANLFLQANYVIGDDVMDALGSAARHEPSSLGKHVLLQLMENNRAGAEESLCVCQDTGLAVVFLTVGQEVYLTGGSLEEAVNAGVRKAYTEGYLRKSVVGDPLFGRTNTGDNTPCVLHTRIVPGDKVHVLAIAKGFGSENMSRLAMLTPAAGVQGVSDFVVETVRLSGPNACPPLVVGIGLGGSFELAALMAKRAASLPLTREHKEQQYAALEKELLQRINGLGIGPAGFGGATTALKVHIITAPTHIAGLPVAVNICCHAARHAEATL
ncbi:MAG: fumarate hydratase [Eubacteriales bacterium]|jgi:fumarate hydratase subunit alpha|nr:fumarate hydratase [Eubacteriales bacterium]MDD4134851.1 fumarate hydratase [Eubacteriales bacterium]